MLEAEHRFFEFVDKKEKHEPCLLEAEVQFMDCTARTLKIHGDYILQLRKTAPNDRKIHLAPDLIFGLFRDSQTDDKWRGITFEKEGKKVYYKCNQPETLIGIKKILSKKIRQRGFHDAYKPLKKIGKGNFASVYLATRIADGKKFAVKVFSKSAIELEQKGVQSLNNQVTIMRCLNHKSLMRLQEMFESDNTIYLVLELLDGGQLCKRTASPHKLTLAQVQRILKSLLSGLAELDRLNIIHRDLKPENILFRSKDSFECVIADFGLATFAHEPEYLFTRCGTPGYVSPEIINSRDSKAKFKPIADVFSLGVIFYEILLGEKLFYAENIQQILTLNRAADYNRYKLEKMIKKEELDLLGRMLEKDPEQRITAAEALKHKYFSLVVENGKVHKQEDCEDIDVEENDLTDKMKRAQSVMPKISINRLNLLKDNKSMPLEKRSSLLEGWVTRDPVYVGTDTVSDIGDSRYSFSKSMKQENKQNRNARQARHSLFKRSQSKYGKNEG